MFLWKHPHLRSKKEKKGKKKWEKGGKEASTRETGENGTMEAKERLFPEKKGGNSVRLQRNVK